MEKRSINKEKLKQEYEFMLAVPAVIKAYYPHVHGLEDCGSYSRYFIERIEVDDASKMLLNHDSDEEVLALLTKVREYLKLVPRIRVKPEEIQTTIEREILKKNNARLEAIRSLENAPKLERLCQDHGYTGVEGYLDRLNEEIKKLLATEDHSYLYFSHGDLCFSNMLNFRDNLYLIDPKGAADKRHNYRTIHYELSKMSQSLLGNYDLIIHGEYHISEGLLNFKHQGKRPKSEAYFKETIESFGSSLQAIRLVEASLFLSLIPFHKESSIKVEAFLLNSLTISKDRI